jgi:hypothetical protein
VTVTLDERHDEAEAHAIGKVAGETMGAASSILDEKSHVGLADDRGGVHRQSKDHTLTMKLVAGHRDLPDDIGAKPVVEAEREQFQSILLGLFIDLHCAGQL